MLHRHRSHRRYRRRERERRHGHLLIVLGDESGDSDGTLRCGCHDGFGRAQSAAEVEVEWGEARVGGDDAEARGAVGDLFDRGGDDSARREWVKMKTCGLKGLTPGEGSWLNIPIGWRLALDSPDGDGALRSSAPGVVFESLVGAHGGLDNACAEVIVLCDDQPEGLGSRVCLSLEDSLRGVWVHWPSFRLQSR